MTSYRFPKGYTPWNKGVKCPEYIKKISSEVNKGKIRSEETRKRMSESHKGKKLSKEHKEKLRLVHIGKSGYWLGKKRSEEEKKKMSESHKGKKPNNALEIWRKNGGVVWAKGRTGELSHCWKGGLSKQPYPFNFNEELKSLIRKRDNFCCSICHIRENGYSHNVHHIDYDKNNINPNNLISLCTSCHFKTNYNRERWIEYFKEVMKCRVMES